MESMVSNGGNQQRYLQTQKFNCTDGFNKNKLSKVSATIIFLVLMQKRKSYKYLKMHT